MNDIKEWFKRKLRKGLAIPPLEAEVEKLNYRLDDKLLFLNQEITALQHKVTSLNQEIISLRETTTLYGISPWYQENLWEPPVQIALRDLCKPGDIVFDIGANFGGLTTVMSRCVGARGIVCAFEASPRIIDKCQRNLVFSGCNNVQLYHAAIYHQSQQKVPIYLGSHLNDSIYSQKQDESPAYQVSTLAIDDFVEQTQLIPNLIKMDIEGAEFDALKGMLKTLEKAKPYLILETQPEDSRCLDFLKTLGYIAIDLNTYRQINSADDYPLGVSIRNNLYIHQDRLSDVPYQPPFSLTPIADFSSEDWIITDNKSVHCKTPLKLAQGRYLIDVDFSAEGISNEMMCGIKIGEKVIFRYHAYTKLLATSYRDWVIHLTEPSEITLYFDFLNRSSDETFMVKSAKIFQVDNFRQSSLSGLPID